jgi:carbamoyltransferase
VQHVWTQDVLGILKRFRQLSTNLCLVGGCALNGVTNYAAQQDELFGGMHLLPNPTDCGLSAGAALYACYDLSKAPFTGCDTHVDPFLGATPFDIGELSSLQARFPHRVLDEAVLPTVVAQLIGQDFIVGIIRGRCEAGPRALGNRSILCNSLHPNMKVILNERVKHREWYRPFAPVVTAEDAPRFFTNVSDIPYMSVICHTRPQFRAALSAVTHVDGSARLQTVRQDQHPFLHATLKAFERFSGVPVLLNTSFNPSGEPILNYCAVGLDMLRTTDLDLVVIENILFAKPGNEALLDRLPPASSGS